MSKICVYALHFQQTGFVLLKLLQTLDLRRTSYIPAADITVIRLFISEVARGLLVQITC